MDYDDFDDLYDDYDEEDEMMGMDDGLGPLGGLGRGGFSNRKSTATSKGAGYGGDGNDKRKRTAGKKQAMKRETKTWKEWAGELKAFLKLKKHTEDDASPKLLNTLKQVLRCQAPEWWWKQPQRNMYITALQVCMVLTEHYPKAWGDPEDDESVMAALEQLAQTSSLLVKQLGKDNEQEHKDDNDTEASQWLSQQLKSPTKTTNDKDSSLPMSVLKIRDQAAAAVKAVLEAPECSMMGSQDYYRKELRPMAFEMVESFENPKHYFARGGGHERGPLRGGYMPPTYFAKGRKKAAKQNSDDNGVKSSATVLWKELSTYPTALPIEYGSSIFVRALENEMDKLRVLIIGPEDTPYANGMFMFDVTMGNDYPNAPPKVQFLTTSSFLSASDKKVRFNPNLYDCGKVCLSLLGTWSGPSWSPGESTLLQVLVSLQSLILGTPDPYFNEPGYQSSEGTPHGKRSSEQYNQNIRKQTLRVAILPFLQNQLRDGTQKAATSNAPGKRKDPPGQDHTNTCHFAEFKQVIEQHFKLKKLAIRKQLFDWLQKDKSLEPLYAEYWNISDQLDQEARLAAAVSSGTSRRQKRSKKVDAPAVKMKDGVILLDDDDDDDALQQALANSLASAGTTAKPKETGDGVILLDSDDEDEMNKKPAAVSKASARGETEEEKKEEPKVVAAVASLPKGSKSGNDEVVDLTC